MSKEAPFRIGSELVELLHDILARPDWQLHFPKFATVPFFEAYSRPGPGDEDRIASGKTSSGDLGFSPFDTPNPHLHVLSPVDDGCGRYHEEDVAYLGRKSPLPSDLTRLFELSRAHRDGPSNIAARSGAEMPKSSSDAAPTSDADFNSLLRLTEVSINGLCVCTPGVLHEHILGPLQYAITAAGRGSSAAEAQLEQGFRNTFNPDTGWGQAVSMILQRVQLDARGHQLEWRPHYFQYSLSVLHLQTCHLQPDCLPLLGRYLLTAKNLIELNLEGNYDLVSAFHIPGCLQRASNLSFIFTRIDH